MSESEIQQVGRILVDIKRLLDGCQHSPEVDQLRGRLNRAIKRYEALPEQIAQYAPFPTQADAQAVVTRECHHVLAALDGAN
jgi:hypothetical protein